MRVADIDDDDPFVHVDLRRREPDAGSGVHGFSHVADELADVRSYRGDRSRDLSQPGIGVFQDVQDHNSLQNACTGCRITAKPLFWGDLGR